MVTTLRVGLIPRLLRPRSTAQMRRIRKVRSTGELHSTVVKVIKWVRLRCWRPLSSSDCCTRPQASNALPGRLATQLTPVTQLNPTQLNSTFPTRQSAVVGPLLQATGHVSHIPTYCLLLTEVCTVENMLTYDTHSHVDHGAEVRTAVANQ